MSLQNNQIPIYAITPKTNVGNLNAAISGSVGTDTNGVTIFTASSSGSRVYSLVANSTDTAIVNLYVYILSGSIVRPLGVATVPLLSGTVSGSLNVDLLDGFVLRGMPVDNTGKRYIELGSLEVLKASTSASMTAAKNCYITALGADYQ